jgi:hypothetical protein
VSYVLVPYLIDLAKLRSAVGSKDLALVEAIRKTDPEKFDLRDDDLTLGDALSQLVMGEKLGRKATHQYGYALIRLCEHLGQRLDADEWSGVRLAALQDSGVAALMQSGPPVKLPKNPDVPLVGFLERAQVAEMVSKMGDEGLTHDDEDLQELLTEFEGWLRAAVKAKRDIVLFFH